MATGVRSLDEQHKELIERLQRLAQAVERDHPRAETASMFDFLDRYVREHFQEEEEAMERASCPAASANLLGHQQFLENFGRLRERFLSEGPTPDLAERMEEDLLEWILEHIVLVDSQLAPAMEKLYGQVLEGVDEAEG